MWPLLALLVAAITTAVTPSATRVERFYPGGRLKSVEYYADGRKTGHHVTWWPNGNWRRSARYRDDAYQGEYRTWRQDGSAYELRHYDRGHESGLQQSWDADGRLFLNYQVIHGRRYGFINAAPCEPAISGEGENAR